MFREIAFAPKTESLYLKTSLENDTINHGQPSLNYNRLGAYFLNFYRYSHIFYIKFFDEMFR